MTRRCADCGEAFSFSGRRHLTRCRPCRDKRYQERKQREREACQRRFNEWHAASVAQEAR